MSFGFAWLVLIIEGLLLGLLSTINSISSIQDSITLLAIVIHAIVVVGCLYSRKNTTHKAMIMMIAAFELRFVCMLWDAYCRDIWHFPDWADTFSFASTAKNYYEGIISGRGGVYPWIICYIYKVVGYRPLFAQYFNVLISISSIVILYKALTRLNLNDYAVESALVWMCLLPYLAINNSLLLREAIIQFLIVLSIYYFVDWYIDGFWYKLAISVCVLMGAACLHSGAIAPALGYCLFVVLYDRSNKRLSITKKTLIMAFVVLVTFYIVNSLLGDVLFRTFGDLDDISDITRAARVHAHGGSSYSIGENSESNVTLALYTPIRMLYFLTSPVPWAWRGLKDVVSFILSAAYYVYVLYTAFVALYRIRRDGGNSNLIWMFLILALAGSLVFSWGVSNAGAAMRHRDKFISIYVALHALCIDAKNKA